MIDTLSKDFLKELSKYYMEFLENDFKSSRPPSRRIKPEEMNDTSLNIDLNNFPQFSHRIYTLLNNNAKNYQLPAVNKSNYMTRFQSDEVIKISNAPDNELSKIIHSILKNKNIQNKTELMDKILLQKELQGSEFSSWIKNMEVSSLYTDITKMTRNKEMIDGQECYLYLSSITYKSNAYPLFYLSCQIDKNENDEYVFEFDPVILINKKAISYLCEQFKKETNKQWIPELPPRHVYLEQFNQSGELLEYMQSIINALCDYLELDIIELNKKEISESKNAFFSLKNDFFLSLFDKSDESLLNDYEEFLNLLQKDSNNEAFATFSKLVNEFLFHNPKSIESDVENDFEKVELSDRFSYYSPIPLNKEQQLALRAIDHKDAERIVIEGPPGTGKSHTITAIIYDALLRGKSVLMVSDKQEALDVVEDKINQALDRMKVDDFVQNPVLRLGKKNNNYHKIFSQTNFNKIKARHSAYKKERDRIEFEIDSILEKIKNDIEHETSSAKKVTIDEVQELIRYEDIFENKWKHLLSSYELEKNDKYTDYLGQMWTIAKEMNEIFIFLEKTNFVDFSLNTSYPHFISTLELLLKEISNISREIDNLDNHLIFSKNINKENVTLLDETLSLYEELKLPVIGYLFSGKKVRELDKKIKDVFLLSSFESLKKQKDILEKELYFYKYCSSVNEKYSHLSFNSFVLLNEDLIDTIRDKINTLIELITNFHLIGREIPETFLSMLISENDVSSYFKHSLSYCSKEEMGDLIHFLLNNQEIMDLTNKMISGEYNYDRNRLEERLVLKMTNILDESVIEFREKYRNDASEIRNSFRLKKQISKENLRKLIRAFPCFIVGIRELGEYIPLEPNLFDVVIIDEASQVSIAQAFPAILRAKKVIVLGDSKQFSNVKSHNASNDINKALFQRVKNTNPSEKIENFNVKNSILEFIKNISNYHTMLKKHFRGYLELIDYSNEHFYDKSLEVMKLRAKPIADVIQFHQIPSSDKKSIRKNTNEEEAQFIVSELISLKEKGFKGTVGIITPFREQQKWISKVFFDHPDYSYFKDMFRLKIMTFDSCQGEERDIVYYSMVERKDEDTLKYIFPVSFSETDESLKSQRLNVGFSRVKESARFVISKDVSSFKGEIGRAMKHFHHHLKKHDHFKVLNGTDIHSPMEKKMYHWIIQTPFYKENQNEIEIIPQFNIGAYLKQLDPTAYIPNYRTDFLMIYRHKTAILEYDGFEYHFKNKEEVNQYNYEHLYTENDIERQKIIESYGYPFVRMNKFILKDDPVLFLEKQFSKHFRQFELPKDDLNENFIKTFEKIENKEIKCCSKCGKMKDLIEFFDPRLKTSYGRVCNHCKLQK